MENSKTKLTAFQIEELTRIKETGFLDKDETKKVVYDLNTKTYVYFNFNLPIKLQKQGINKEGAERVIVETCPALPKRMVLDICDNVYITFNPFNNEKEYELGGAKFLNEFDVAKTNLSFKDEAKEYERFYDISFLNQYKYVKPYLSNLFGGEKEVEYFINWMATAAQTRKKLKTSILIQSEQGAGKNILENNVIRTIFGQEYVYTAGNEQITTRFNGSFQNKLFVVFNEVNVDFNKSNTVAEKLKWWITEDSLEIERKGIDSNTSDNFFNTILFSNERNPIKIDASDRRYNVFKSNGTLLNVAKSLGMSEHNFYERLIVELRDFCFDLFRFNFDYEKTIRAMETEHKKAIAGSTSEKIDLLGKLLNDGNYLEVENYILDIIDTKRALGTFFERNYNQVLINLKEEMKDGFISTESQVFLYNNFIDESLSLSAIKIGKMFSSILGESVPRYGKRVRKIRNKFEEKETKSVILEEVKEDKTFEEVLEVSLIKEDVKEVVAEIKEIIEVEQVETEERINFLEKNEFLSLVYMNELSLIEKIDKAGSPYHKFLFNGKVYACKKGIFTEKEEVEFNSFIAPF